ncbi:MAG: Holliday junction resolvase RuvX [Flavobacteriales bacterium]|nr:Holliday junction resolvase RuvX [Flavobacteriales bacterium]
MSKILAIDYGQKRTGVAITDELQIIASPLETVPTQEFFCYLEKLLQKEKIETIVVGLPLRLNGEESATTQLVRDFTAQIRKKFPALHIEMIDEAFTSKLAARALVEGGMKKKDRQKKENLDKVSAAIILQSYLQLHG